MKDKEVDKRLVEMFDESKKKIKERGSLKLNHPITFAYTESTKTGNKFEGADEINVELKTKELKTFGDVVDADKLDTLRTMSYEKQILLGLVYHLLTDIKSLKE